MKRPVVAEMGRIASFIGAPTPEPIPQEDTFICKACKKRHPLSELQKMNGKRLCEGCASVLSLDYVLMELVTDQ